MIVTVTPNPSLDLTFPLSAPLAVNKVQVTEKNTLKDPGGKGINVARVLAGSGLETIALLIADKKDTYYQLLKQTKLPFETVETNKSVRINATLTDPEGNTTKINSVGPEYSTAEIINLEHLILAKARTANWIVLSGSLARGFSENWYYDILKKLKNLYPTLKVAIDTSGEPLINLAKNLTPALAPNLMKPNAQELGLICDLDGDLIEKKAEKGDYGPAIEGAKNLQQEGVEYVLLTLGAAGAVLATPTETPVEPGKTTTVKSTIGAGDSALAGFIYGLESGLSTNDALKLAVTYGTAAASLPGTGIPLQPLSISQ